MTGSSRGIALLWGNYVTALYNEFDPYAAEWLRNLIRDGHIAPGTVDARSVTDIQPYELMLPTQVHFYAGIGGWSAALRLAGYPDDEPIWSMSLPCQPFSSAGKQKGIEDERHLWPVSYQHIRACRPLRIVGEQVASKDGRAWLELVQADLEALDYQFWAVILPVAGFGCPGERHRTFWLAYSDGGYTGTARLQRSGEQRLVTSGGGPSRLAYSAPVGRGESGAIGSGFRCRDGTEGHSAGSVSGSASQRVGNADHPRPQGRSVLPERTGQCAAGEGRVGGGMADTPDGGYDGSGDIGGRRSGDSDRRGDDRMADADGARYVPGALPGIHRVEGGAGSRDGEPERPDTTDRPGPLNGFWRDADWLLCTDHRWRPTKPGSSVLAYGLPRGMAGISPWMGRMAMVADINASSLKAAKRCRVGTLRGFGNAINLQVAAEWIKVWMDDLL